jgi:large subunit ribosomal protein L22
VAAALRARKNAAEAVAYLGETPGHGAVLLQKVLRSAMANARVKNPNVDVDRLSVKEIRVDEGPRFYRHRFCARGQVHPVRKRFCHIRVVVTDGKGA